MVMVMMPLIMLLLVRRIVLITLLLILLGRDGFQDVIRPFLGRVLLTVSFHRIHRQTGILYHCVRSLRTETSHRLSDPLLYRVSCKAISLLYPQFFFCFRARNTIRLGISRIAWNRTKRKKLASIPRYQQLREREGGGTMRRIIHQRVYTCSVRMCPLEKSSLGFPCKLLRCLFVQITRDAISRAYQCTCWSAGTVFLATQHLSERRKQTNPITSTESTVNPATAPITSGICNKYAAGGKKKAFYWSQGNIVWNVHAIYTRASGYICFRPF